MVREIITFLFIALLVCRCKPSLDQTVSLVGGPRILAVQANPAEAAPTGTVAYSALVVDANGVVPGAQVSWSYCTARNPLANLGPVSDVCLQQGGDQSVGIGVGTLVSGTIPDIACRQFGPEVPVPVPGQPPGRPVDPDPTGGYYQPVTLVLPTDQGPVLSIEEARLSCGVASASADQAADYANRYHTNANPAVASLTSGGAPLATDDSGMSNVVSKGATLQLEVAWAGCPLSDTCGDGVCGPDESAGDCPGDCTTPVGCTGAERYVTLDLASHVLVDAREGMHVSWFATGGSFLLDRNGVDGSDTTTTSDDTWTAPAQPGTVHLWVVLRDDRGGIGWGAYTLQVRVIP